MARNTRLFRFVQAMYIVVLAIIACVIPCCAANHSLDNRQEQITLGAGETDDAHNNAQRSRLSERAKE